MKTEVGYLKLTNRARPSRPDPKIILMLLTIRKKRLVRCMTLVVGYPLRQKFSFGISVSSTFKVVSFRKSIYVITITLSVQMFLYIARIWNKRVTNLGLTEWEYLKSQDISRRFPPPFSSSLFFVTGKFSLWLGKGYSTGGQFSIELVNGVQVRVLSNLLNILYDFKPAFPMFVWTKTTRMPEQLYNNFPRHCFWVSNVRRRYF
jgi:hypothetical protein